MSTFVVTGGTGFVGSALSLRLRRDGHVVKSVARRPAPNLVDAGVEVVSCDMTQDTENLQRVCDGADGVFHVAAKVDMWGCYDDFYRANVIGTRNVIDACFKGGVPRLVYTSSPSVVADGKNLRGVDESYPYPENYKAFYPQTKAAAEQEVLKAHGDKLSTVALRPHLIYGPGDTNLGPTVLARARAGRLVQIGSGENLVDFSFIEDCVEAHVCAFNALGADPSVGGQPYFISQGDPTPLWEWIGEVLRLNDVAPISRTVSYRTADLLAWACEKLVALLPGDHEPLLTRFLVSEMATDHYFDISAARERLGYQPRYSVMEGLRRTYTGQDHDRQVAL